MSEHRRTRIDWDADLVLARRTDDAEELEVIDIELLEELAAEMAQEAA